MNSGANLSPCQTYRYLLWRIWNEDKRLLAFVMLNPSTAAHTNDDRTIRRCMRFAAANGYGGILVANLFAYRCTDPSELPGNETAIGPDNDAALSALSTYARNAADVVFAWGTKGTQQQRNLTVAAMFPGAFCLECTKDGHPKHPLYIRSDAKLTIYTTP